MLFMMSVCRGRYSDCGNPAGFSYSMLCPLWMSDGTDLIPVLVESDYITLLDVTMHNSAKPSFLPCWLSLFVSSYIVHSVRALLALSRMEGQCAQSLVKRMDTPYYASSTYSTGPFIICAMLQLIILTTLGYVLLEQFSLPTKVEREYQSNYTTFQPGTEHETCSHKTDCVLHYALDERDRDTQTETCSNIEESESDPGYASQDQASETSEDNWTMTIHVQKQLQWAYSSLTFEDCQGSLKFDLLPDETKLAIDEDDETTTKWITTTAFWQEDNVPRLYAQLCGYAIIKNKQRALRIFAEFAESARRHICTSKEWYLLGDYIRVAIANRCHDITLLLQHYFPRATDFEVHCASYSAIHRDDMPQLEFVWPYLKDKHQFLEITLREALLRKQSEALRFIIREYSIRGAGGLGNTLRDAVIAGDYGTIRIWLRQDVDVRRPVGLQSWKRSEFPRSVLSIAAEKGDVEIMRMLLDKDLANHPDKAIMPGLLETALSNGHDSIARLLLARGADMLEVALDTAVGAGWGHCVRTLLRSGRRDFKSALYGTVLQRACTSGDLQTVQLLFEYGHAVNPNSPMALGGNSPLMAAISGRHTGLVKSLISMGASVSAARSIFGNALQTAVFLRGQAELVATVLEHTVFVDACILPEARLSEHSPSMPLALAIDRGDVNLVELLLEKGACEALLSDTYRLRLHKLKHRRDRGSCSKG
ncbi:ankyrin repeat-containing domain protein [Aspergillus californicus]